jgi:uncharacterized iron-regulated membrane protein
MRKILFWIHLCVGVTAAAIVMLMSVTGVLLTYEKQSIAWSDRAFRSNPGGGAVSLERILAKAPEAASVTIYADPNAAAAVALGRAGTAYADAYTGERLGMATKEVRGFLGTMKEWHRWIGLQGESRATGRAITGAANLGFLFLVVSGAYLWLPAVFSSKHFRAIAWFRGGLSGKARDFNWHNVIGVWCVVPLFLIVISGVVIGYGWASNLVLQLGGVSPQAPPSATKEEKTERPFDGVDAALRAAMLRDPAWRSIGLRSPVSNLAPLVFTIDSGTGGQPQKRGTLTYDRQQAKAVKWEDFDSLERGRQWRNWMRFVHTGEYYGILGQTIAGLASLGGAFLVWTGVALSLRRFSAWRRRRNRSSIQVEATASQPAA